jgi:kynurenine formamidase
VGIGDSVSSSSDSGRLWPPGRRATTHYRDLTLNFSPELISPPNMAPQSREHTSVDRDSFAMREWTFFEHTGTHVDAPSHFIESGRSATELTPEELIVPAIVVDISSEVALNSNAAVTIEDLIKFETSYGKIPRRAMVLMYSGWEHRTSSWNEYIGLDAEGSCSFPGFDPDAARWLAEHRDISGIGVDTSSLDTGSNTYRQARKPGNPPTAGEFPTHRVILGADRYGLENVRNHGTMPPAGIELFVGLVPWERGSGGPCRLLARY